VNFGGLMKYFILKMLKYNLQIFLIFPEVLGTGWKDRVKLFITFMNSCSH